jgi:endoglucanase
MNSLAAEEIRIGSDQISLLESLSNAVAVSGDEGEVRTIVLQNLRRLGCAYRVDAMGNVLVEIPAQRENARRVMVSAHMDEVGFMLVAEDGPGLYQFDVSGIIEVRQWLGKAVWVGKSHQPGVIGLGPIHLTSKHDRQSPPPLSSLRVDVGPEGGKTVKLGDRGTWAARFSTRGPSLVGKALDNRLGVATLVELIRLKPAGVHLLAAFTTQEEVGLRGARVSAYSLEPESAIAVDCTPAFDLPRWDGSENAAYNSRLGAGPAIYLADKRTIADPRLVAYLESTATRHGIPCQYRQPGGGGTDAGAIHRTRGGVPSISVSVPGRYAHSAAGLCRTADWENTLRLLFHALDEWNPEGLA